MKIDLPPVSHELVFFSDVDDTLIFDYITEKHNPYSAISLDYYGQSRLVVKSIKHIEFLKSLRARGYYIIVWTGNGKQWADEVVDKLDLKDVVSQTMMKPSKYLDDLPCQEWMGTKIYLEDEKNE